MHSINYLNSNSHRSQNFHFNILSTTCQVAKTLSTSTSSLLIIIVSSTIVRVVQLYFWFFQNIKLFLAKYCTFMPAISFCGIIIAYACLSSSVTFCLLALSCSLLLLSHYSLSDRLAVRYPSLSSVRLFIYLLQKLFMNKFSFKFEYSVYLLQP